MKTINFSVVEILPSLLDRSKTQTIRPAWKFLSPQLTPQEHREEHIKRCPACFRMYMIYKKTGRYPTNEELSSNRVNMTKICKETYKNMPDFFPKPPRFKVGDKVKLFWNQRSKYQWFCRCCKKESKKCKTYSNLMEEFYPELFFNKLLGTAEITEVFKIEMRKDNGKYKIKTYLNQPIKGAGHYKGWLKGSEDLAKRDGFSSAESMFRTIDKMYDLSSPKTFWCYRWVWK